MTKRIRKSYGLSGIRYQVKTSCLQYGIPGTRYLVRGTSELWGSCCPSFFFFLFHRIYYPRTTLALPPSSNSDPGSHSGPSPPPSHQLLSTTVRAFILYREKNSAFSSLVDSRRIVRTHAARRSQQVTLFFSLFLHFCRQVRNLTTGRNRTRGPTLQVLY